MPKKRGNKTQKQLAPVFHIYCEGEKTEPNYFNGYIGKCFPGNRRLRVFRVEKTNKNTPIQLIEEAIKHKTSKDCPEEDVFWVVFDRESTVKYPDTLHLQAYQKANSNDVNIALSNICFELWILLHFEKCTAAFSCYDDLKKNSNLFKTHIKDYDKGSKNIFNIVKDKVNDARKNALDINKITENAADASWTKPYQFNPFSEVYKLLDAIDGFGK